MQFGNGRHKRYLEKYNQSWKTVRAQFAESNLFIDAWNVKMFMLTMEKIENVKWHRECVGTYFMDIVLKSGLKQSQMEPIKDYVDNVLKSGTFQIKSY